MLRCTVKRAVHYEITYALHRSTFLSSFISLRSFDGIRHDLLFGGTAFELLVANANNLSITPDPAEKPLIVSGHAFITRRLRTCAGVAGRSTYNEKLQVPREEERG